MSEAAEREPLDLEHLAREALAAERLDASHLPDVMRYLADESDVWRNCCGGFCDPCVSTLARVVDRVRRAALRARV